MPAYDRFCKECEDIFVVNSSYAVRDDKCDCPQCSSNEGVWVVSAPSLVSRSERLMTKQKDRGFNEVLSRLKERNPRTEVANRI